MHAGDDDVIGVSQQGQDVGHDRSALLEPDPLQDVDADDLVVGPVGQYAALAPSITPSVRCCEQWTGLRRRPGTTPLRVDVAAPALVGDAGQVVATDQARLEVVARRRRRRRDEGCRCAMTGMPASSNSTQRVGRDPDVGLELDGHTDAAGGWSESGDYERLLRVVLVVVEADDQLDTRRAVGRPLQPGLDVLNEPEFSPRALRWPTTTPRVHRGRTSGLPPGSQYRPPVSPGAQ